LYFLLSQVLQSFPLTPLLFSAGDVSEVAFLTEEELFWLE
jgi:hypothetical protein